MRTRTCIALAALAVCARAPAEPDEFLPPIGIVDFHGLRSHSEAEVRPLLPFKEGDRVKRAPGYKDGSAVARALGVPQVNFSFICCTPDQKVIAFIGVAEKPPPPWPAPPAGSERLTDDMMKACDEANERISELVRSGKPEPEDHSQGHSLNAWPPLRSAQERLVAFARERPGLIVKVLANSSDAAHRAAAATLTGYLPDKAAAAKALAAASSDPNPTVRNNATRALGIIAEYSLAHPELKIHIDPAPFIAMLNSPTWTDLNKGIFVLSSLSASRDPDLLARLRNEARAALIDICRWKSTGHGTPGCIVLRRVEGMPDWGEREEVLKRAGADGTQPPRKTSTRNR